MIKLIIGLGNPGPQYLLNRHNVGFLVVDALSRAYGAGEPRIRDKGAAQEITVGGHRVFLFKPLSYMNLSGGPAASFATFYKIDPSAILVIHDDLEVAPGRMRIKNGGSSGGHNGLKSLDSHLGPGSWRLRIGIGRPDHKDQVSGYVLGDFSSGDQGWLSHVMAGICDHTAVLLTDPPGFLTHWTAENRGVLTK